MQWISINNLQAGAIIIDPAGKGNDISIARKGNQLCMPLSYIYTMSATISWWYLWWSIKKDIVYLSAYSCEGVLERVSGGVASGSVQPQSAKQAIIIDSYLEGSSNFVFPEKYFSFLSQARTWCGYLVVR